MEQTASCDPAAETDTAPMDILVVGDKHEERIILQKAVERLGHRCHIAEDGDQGWQVFLDHSLDVVLSDFIMPGLNGIELCQQVRLHPRDHYTYFIVLSTLHERSHVLAGLQSGCDDYLRKPVDVEELEARLISARRVTSLHKRLARQNRELERLSGQLREESRRDPLTQVGNRLRFNEDAVRLLDEHRRYRRRFCLALCDIDNFKKYNDTFGHLAGDENLRMVAAALRAGTRASDQVYRFGGEEFLLIFTEQSLEEARVACERLRQSVQGRRLAHPENQPYGVVTLTFGLAGLGEADTDLQSAIHRADMALYEGKEGGRNRVVLAD